MTGQDENIKVAVITGGHHFDVLNFHDLFSGFEGIRCYIQHIDDFCKSTEDVRDSYDVVLFYIMMMDTPEDEGTKFFQGRQKSALEHMGQTRQGIFILHHALLAYPKWQFWSDLTGIKDRSFGYHIGECFTVNVTKADHPITRGLSDWQMVDETYTMDDTESGEILLNVEHEKSMKHIAWTRQYNNARVFNFQSGHDNETWQNQNFCEVLRRGLLWCAGQI